MRKLLNIFVLVVSLIAVLNCAKEKEKFTVEEIGGVKYYKNTGEPTGKYRPSVKLLFDITGPENVPDSMQGFGLIADVLCDDLENIYILDMLHATVKKYNRSGEFERYFPEQSGEALESVKKPSQFTILYDTLIVYDGGKWVEYLTNGKYLFSKEYYIGGEKLLNLNSDGRNYLSAFLPKADKNRGDSIPYLINNLCILGRRYEPQNVIK
ncbi:MAG: hypothetical protein KKD38_10600, partial [Candidatus Delongbacteria bacterium]|nr:hypothetical protein [Candidatus Delongbacteria bacterium]MCG2761007.1 hypothetical protein [Candidatus Delongbacteria bacterium]